MPKQEDVLIGLCAHLESNIEREKEIKRIINSALNWSYFLEKVKKERVVSLVYKTLSRIDSAEKIIPEGILSNLKELYYFTLRENLLIFSDLEKLLNCFNNERIKTIVFKGPMLAEAVYKDIGLRPMSDVDILIRKEDLPRADRILKEFGYGSSINIQDFSKIPDNPYRNSIMYKNPNAGIKPAHLYWHIINVFSYNSGIFKRIDMHRIWEETIPLTLANAEINTFSTHHQIIYLCMHSFNHSFSQLVLLCDINEFLRLNKDAIDWFKLVNEAVLLGLTKYLYYGLYVCKRLLGTHIPGSVLEQTKPKRISLFERRFIDSVLERKVANYGEILTCFGMNESLSVRIRFLKGALFPPKDLFPLIKQTDLIKVSSSDYLKRIKTAVQASLRVLRNIVF